MPYLYTINEMLTLQNKQGKELKGQGSSIGTHFAIVKDQFPVCPIALRRGEVQVKSCDVETRSCDSNSHHRVSPGLCQVLVRRTVGCIQTEGEWVTPGSYTGQIKNGIGTSPQILQSHTLGSCAATDSSSRLSSRGRR